MARDLWTREQLILVLNLYLKIPFGKMHKQNPDVIEMAKLINRSPGSIAMRLGNFATVDPYHQKRGVGGLPGGRKQVEPIWNEFINNKEELLYESERILAKYEHQTIEEKFASVLKDLSNYKGETKIREVKTRVNQNIFRQIIVNNYSNKCAVTGIDIPTLLVASHIVPWSKNENERLNPENGICLSSLHDCAFDNGLIGISLDYKIILSSKLRNESAKEYFDDYFGKYENECINLPERFLPRIDFLDYHLNECFIP